MVSTRGSPGREARAVSQAAAAAPPAANPPPPPQQAAAAPQVPVPAAPAAPPPAQAVHAALDPALAAIAATLGNNQAQSQAQAQAQSESESEPEDEPSDGNPSEGEEEHDDAPTHAVKVDLRNIKVERFDGTVPQGSFDAKAREFCEELDEQMDDAQALAGQVWSDDIKKAVFKIFLKGIARRAYRDWRLANPNASYADGVARMTNEFRPVLLGVDIAERIKKERKKWNETYRDFADRLMQMADALEGGKAIPANARHALVAFVRNAYPKFTDFVETKVNLNHARPEEQLKLAVSVLTAKAETDGRLPERVKTKASTTAAAAPAAKKTPKPQGKKPKRARTEKDSKKRPAEAHAAVVERKKKPKTTNISTPKGSFKCYECGASGHTAEFCRTYLNGNKSGEFGQGQGEALNVEAAMDEESGKSQ